jgi:hypothetical protein
MTPRRKHILTSAGGSESSAKIDEGVAARGACRARVRRRRVVALRSAPGTKSEKPSFSRHDKHCGRTPMRSGDAFTATAALAVVLMTASGPVLAQTSGAAPNANAATQSSTDPRPIQDLMKAAQQLRDATHDLVREQPSAQRNQIISKIDKTLRDVQAAMVNLPPDLMLAGVDEAQSKKASTDLANAADRLQQSSKALSADASPQQRGQAMNDIRQALAQIQQERMKIAGGANTTTGSGAASGGAASSSPSSSQFK